MEKIIYLRVFACENSQQSSFFENLQMLLKKQYFASVVEKQENGEYLTLLKKVEIIYEQVPPQHWDDLLGGLTNEDDSLPPLLIGERFTDLNFPVICIPYHIQLVKAFLAVILKE